MVPYKPKDYIKITRRLVESCEGRDLLMVRHHTQIPPFSSAYTRNIRWRCSRQALKRVSGFWSPPMR
jgi:hypothetical protein